MKFKLVHVTWIDSAGANSRWRFLNTEVNEPKVLSCHSVGYLVQDTKKAKRIAAHISVDDDGDVQICGDIVIPSVAIEKMAVIEEAS